MTINSQLRIWILALSLTTYIHQSAWGAATEEEIINPFDTDARLLRIEKFRKESKFIDAEKEIGSCAKMGCEPNRVLEERAHLAFDQKDFAAAYTHYSKLITLKHNILLSRARRARAAHKLKRYDNAIQDLTLLSKENPNSLPIKLLLGEIYSEIKNTKQARKIFTDILALQPNHTATSLQLAKLDLNSGLFQGAEARLLELSKSTAIEQPEAAQLLVTLKLKQSLSSAGNYLREYIEQYPTQEWAFNQYANLLEQVHEEKLMKHILERASKIPNAHGAWFNLGVLEHRNENYPEASRWYKSIPSDSRLYLQAQANLVHVHDLPQPLDKNLKSETPLMSTPSEMITIAVEAGDTLQKVSDRAYGTTRRWQEIEKLNQDVLKGKTDLTVGMQLKLSSDVKTLGRNIGSVENAQPKVVKKIIHNRIVIHY